jgi:hypothetical protein
MLSTQYVPDGLTGNDYGSSGRRRLSTGALTGALPATGTGSAALSTAARAGRAIAAPSGDLASPLPGPSYGGNPVPTTIAKRSRGGSSGADPLAAAAEVLDLGRDYASGVGPLPVPGATMAAASPASVPARTASRAARASGARGADVGITVYFRLAWTPNVPASRVPCVVDPGWTDSDLAATWVRQQFALGPTALVGRMQRARTVLELAGT